MRALPCKGYRSHDNAATQGRVDVATFCMYIFHWDEAKRQSNLGKHGFDFADAALLFEGTTFTREDCRFSYLERRFITLGLLRTKVVVLVHTETRNTLRIISLRKATSSESKAFFAQIAN